jgi:hypothetical protein
VVKLKKFFSGMGFVIIMPASKNNLRVIKPFMLDEVYEVTVAKSCLKKKILINYEKGI